MEWALDTVSCSALRNLDLKSIHGQDRKRKLLDFRNIKINFFFIFSIDIIFIIFTTIDYALARGTFLHFL